MKKRGQVALLLAMVIAILGFVLITQIPTERAETPPLTPLAFDSIEPFVQSCLFEAAESSLATLGLQGGYAELQGMNFAADDALYPVYSLNDTSSIPTLLHMEEALSTMVMDEALFCTGGFHEFTLQGYTFEYSGEPQVRTSISSGEVLFELALPLAVTLDSTKKSLSSFVVKKRVDLVKTNAVVSELMAAIEEDVNSIPLSTILDLTEKYDIDIDTIEYPNAVVYGLRDYMTDPSSDEPYLFMFAVQVPGVGFVEDE